MSNYTYMLLKLVQSNYVITISYRFCYVVCAVFVNMCIAARVRTTGQSNYKAISFIIHSCTISLCLDQIKVTFQESLDCSFE